MLVVPSSVHLSKLSLALGHLVHSSVFSWWLGAVEFVAFFHSSAVGPVHQAGRATLLQGYFLKEASDLTLLH